MSGIQPDTGHRKSDIRTYMSTCRKGKIAGQLHSSISLKTEARSLVQLENANVKCLQLFNTENKLCVCVIFGHIGYGICCVAKSVSGASLIITFIILRNAERCSSGWSDFWRKKLVTCHVVEDFSGTPNPKFYFDLLHSWALTTAKTAKSAKFFI